MRELSINHHHQTVNVERCDRSWPVTIPKQERYDLIRDGEHPPDRAIAAVADQENIVVDELHTSVARSRDGRTEVVVRRH